MRLKTKFKLLGVILILCAVGAGFLCVRFYGYVFGPTVTGEVITIEKFAPMPNDQIPGDDDPAHRQSYSYSVAIRDKTGRIFAVSTKDRQWAVVDKGDCVRAALFVHPPWDPEKSGTYYGARLKKLRKGCQGPAV